MSDLIRREDVLGACIGEAQKARRYQFGQIWELNYYEIKEAINSIPTAEPKVGRWISVSSFEAFGGDEICWEIRGNPTAFHYCSACKEQASIDEFGDEILSKYCPNCGAKMEKRIDERKKITIERNICPKPECGDEFPIPKEGWKGESDEHSRH